MPHSRLLLALLVAALPLAAGAQRPLGGGQIAATSPATLYQQLVGQAHVRFSQAGVEPSEVSWRLLDGAIKRGVDRLADSARAASVVSRARRSLNAFVDDMIHAASWEDGGLVAHESSFSEAMRRCKPPKYPICP